MVIGPSQSDDNVVAAGDVVFSVSRAARRNSSSDVVSSTESPHFWPLFLCVTLVSERSVKGSPTPISVEFPLNDRYTGKSTSPPSTSSKETLYRRRNCEARQEVNRAIERTEGWKKERKKKERRQRKKTPRTVAVGRDSVARRGTSDRSRDTAVRRSTLPHPTSSAMPGPRADQYFGSDTRRGGRGRAAPSAAEPRHEASRVPPPRAALPAQSLCGSGRRGMCGIVTASVIEE
ncbi:hypothetical protein ALC60_12819 [Trachymyrmex zeteki]|uniref:Uncharacterized protein n=1 Tax=Mycetomoellerius zeteki TaxID=64791 RepID=A0A151WJX5_9HYME|nr:hypothetical protein ALC60_12819 [Trachymyrmex zeteki]